MPTAADIIINDATPTPHTFAPQSVSPEKTILVDRDSATSAGFKSILASFSPARSSRPTNRVNLRFAMPTEHTVDGVVLVAYVARCNIDLVLPEEMTQTERDDFGAFVENLLADTVVQGYVTDLAPMH
jgi:hypothetical protein